MIIAIYMEYMVNAKDALTRWGAIQGKMDSQDYVQILPEPMTRWLKYAAVFAHTSILECNIVIHLKFLFVLAAVGHLCALIQTVLLKIV